MCVHIIETNRKQAWRHAGSQHERLHLALETAVSVRGGAYGAYKGGGGGEERGADGGRAGWQGGGGRVGGGESMDHSELQANGRLRQLVSGPILEILRYFDHLHAAQGALQGDRDGDGDGQGGGGEGRERGGGDAGGEGEGETGGGGGDAGERKRHADAEVKLEAAEDARAMPKHEAARIVGALQKGAF